MFALSSPALYQLLWRSWAWSSALTLRSILTPALSLASGNVVQFRLLVSRVTYSFCLMSVLCIWQLRLRGTSRHQAMELPPSEIHDNSTSWHSWGICLSPLTDPVENLALSPLFSHFSHFFLSLFCVFVLLLALFFKYLTASWRNKTQSAAFGKVYGNPTVKCI